MAFLSKKQFLSLFSSLMLLAFLVLQQELAPSLPITPPPSTPVASTSASIQVLGTQDFKHETATLRRVIDGDTIELESGEKLRYIGIDTPETKHPQKGVECFGKEASEKNRELVEGKTLQLQKDVSETDRYGRLLRYVFVDGILINEVLVREGYAKASSYPPDIKYQELLQQAEQEARENQRGLWGQNCQYNQ